MAQGVQQCGLANAGWPLNDDGGGNAWAARGFDKQCKLAGAPKEPIGEGERRVSILRSGGGPAVVGQLVSLARLVQQTRRAIHGWRNRNREITGFIGVPREGAHANAAYRMCWKVDCQ